MDLIKDVILINLCIYVYVYVSIKYMLRLSIFVVTEITWGTSTWMSLMLALANEAKCYRNMVW